MGGFIATFLGGPMHGKDLWLVSIEPTYTIHQFRGLDEYLRATKQEGVQISPDGVPLLDTKLCDYTLMPFFAPGGNFLYIAFEDGDLED